MKKQKQLSRGALRKSCSENIQQIYRRTPMPKYDFNKVATLLKSHFVMGVLLLRIFRTLFYKNTCGGLLLKKWKWNLEKANTKKSNPKRPFQEAFGAIAIMEILKKSVDISWLSSLSIVFQDYTGPVYTCF